MLTNESTSAKFLFATLELTPMMIPAIPLSNRLPGLAPFDQIEFKFKS